MERVFGPQYGQRLHTGRKQFRHHRTGGTIQVLAGGDGRDSNGSIEMTGGTVVVRSTGGGDGALDYESSFTLDGGILFASAVMAANPRQPESTRPVRGLRPDAGGRNLVQFKGDGTRFCVPTHRPFQQRRVQRSELEGGAVCTSLLWQDLFR